MKKRIFLFLTLAALAGGGVFAQTHFVSAEVTFLGGGARYEYVLNPYFTIGGHITYVYFPTHFLPEGFVRGVSGFSTGIAGRWYPGGRIFFAELGMGYGSFTYNYDSNGMYETWTASGLILVPGFGWTIDIGAPGGLFISPGIRLPFLLIGDEIFIGHERYSGPVSGTISFGLGYAF